LTSKGEIGRIEAILPRGSIGMGDAEEKVAALGHLTGPEVSGPVFMKLGVSRAKAPAAWRMVDVERRLANRQVRLRGQPQ
jgi:hypothetical protein